MSVIEHIKEIISPHRADDVQAWIEQRFSVPEQTIATEVVRWVLSHTHTGLDQLSAETRWIEDLALNELQRVQLVLAVEQEFHVVLSNQDAENINTLGGLVRCLRSKARANEAGGNLVPVEPTSATAVGFSLNPSIVLPALGE